MNIQDTFDLKNINLSFRLTYDYSHFRLNILINQVWFKKGAFWPSVSSFWAFWAPASERSRMVGISSSGSRIGNIVGLAIGSSLCIYGFAGGWPSIFYIFGIQVHSFFNFFLINVKQKNLKKKVCVASFGLFFCSF